ncbi:hypothetical protein O6H91_03G034400 [Diphasiastrum complanatum]|uniref:Uncharacterized protein n=1 Tax=Diphasiastrum complanatum TaxID=34168 RepID=A0ACC2E4Y2_DIPCM|nr:hypothetical protein O6H91_03G034400 [Diphasiastrum complanatum]
MYRMTEKVSSYEGYEDEIYRSPGPGYGKVYHEPSGADQLHVSGKKGRGHQHWSKSSKLDFYLDSDDEGYRSSGSTVGLVDFHNNQNVIAARKGKERGSASSKALPPYQTVVINVLTQCDECVRKVKKAVARAEGVESISVDMNLKRITVKGPIDPQKVLKRASKTGKSVELLSLKGSSIKSAPLYEQQAARSDCLNLKQDYFHDPSDQTPQKSATDRYHHSSGDKFKKTLENNQQMKGVRFNLTPGEESRNIGKRAMKKNGIQYKQGSVGNTKEKLEYEPPESPEMHPYSSDHYIQYSKGERMTQDSEYYQRPGGQKFKQKRADHDTQSTAGEIFKQNLTYPASRDDGSYIFSDENANNCCVM